MNVTLQASLSAEMQPADVAMQMPIAFIEFLGYMGLESLVAGELLAAVTALHPPGSVHLGLPQCSGL